MSGKPLIFRQHAIKRMFERTISVADVESVLSAGQVIEDYPSDTPYPSALVLGYSENRPLHVVVADSVSERIIITVYEPDSSQWMPDWKKRSKP